ncbi:DUF4430 domain-containing protein [Parablautia sp. Marseille-Q6255]|uniref:DUF4430 domain-containing protein n=1 Tax=Parablautia sp. Marseille-Q6255 TaxID=3039593 RepID=UPI0024BD0E45|nr:DUF4430 domain-containing protein [Parablautia sp. Marseille-Q6255]
MRKQGKKQAGRFLSFLMAGMLVFTSVPTPVGAERLTVEDFVSADAGLDVLDGTDENSGESDRFVEQDAGVPEEETAAADVGAVQPESIPAETQETHLEDIPADTEGAELEMVPGETEVIEPETDVPGMDVIEGETETLSTEILELETDDFIEAIVPVEEETGESESELLKENQNPGTYMISSAAEIPEHIYAGQTYELTADITLDAGQQIASIAGVLDGKGHVITLADKPLAKDVTGTIQNLGVTGAITVTSQVGSICESLTGGTLQNSYSSVDMAISGWSDPGGLAGIAKAATIRNSYYAGTVSGNYPMPGGLTSYAEAGSTFANCYYTPSAITAMGSEGSGYTKTNCAQKSLDEFRSGAVTELLNAEMTLTGYHFASAQSGLPTLAAGNPEVPEGTVDWTALDAAIKKAEELSQKDYTAQSWEQLANAVAAGKELKKTGTDDQTEVEAAVRAIEEALSALKEKDPYKPVAIPENAVKISSQADFTQMMSSAGKYYVLTQDITIDVSYDMGWMPFYGVLDGQGHTIRFDGGGQLFARVEAGAVVQNVNFAGEVRNSRTEESAPLGANLYGSILNCRSDVTGEYVSGFVQKLACNQYEDARGIIANSIFVGDTGKGAFYAADGGGELHNSWAVGINSEEEMTSKGLVSKLNEGKGEYGTQWGQGRDGYPYFGPDQEYDGSVSWPELPQDANKYPIAFTAYNTSDKVVLEDRQLQISPDVCGSNHESGQFSLEGYTIPEGSHIEWELTYARPEASFGRNLDTGMLYIYGTGKAVMEARQVNEDGSSEFLAAAAILATKRQMTEIRLLIDGQDVTNGAFTVQGSQQKSIQVQARYAGSEVWNEVSRFGFDYVTDEAGKEYLSNYTDSYSSFYFKKPGTATITVASKDQPELSGTVTVTSEYVPVESVKPANPQAAELHARNANSDGQESDGRVAFNRILGNAIVTPVHASNADKVEITSSDETIAYFAGGEKAFVPKQAGTVTFTAKIEDTDPATGKTKTVTGSTDTVFTYLNPVESIALAEEYKEQTVAAGEETAEFEVEVTGARTDEGYEVTEPALKWTYSKNGIAQVVRVGSGYWKKDPQEVNDPDYGDYLAAAAYQIRGLSEGTVVATGTPIDKTNPVEPVQITITVTKGSEENKNLDQIAAAGANGALDYIEHAYSQSGYAYGNEWIIYGMLQAGREVDGGVLDAYYQSVAETAGSWTQNQKPTDIARTILALARMGKDVTNVGGVDLAAMLYNHPSLNAGSNELTYALLALDAADITIPSEAKWTRDAMITALLTFRSTDGGFGLYDSSSSGVDTTAMALQGLANYRNRPAVKTAIDKALDYLRGQMRDDFGYGTSEATAQVLLALVGLGIDPTSQESGFGSPNFNMITNLMQYQKGDGGFSHLVSIDKSQEMSTVQALQALDAYRSRKEGSYWNISTVKAAVTFSMYGDDVHESDKDGHVHTLLEGNLQQWIADTEYRVADGGTVADVIDMALAANGMTCEKKYGGAYIASVTRNGVKLAEFSNGRKSGWMYALNGVHPETGIAEQTLKDGDKIIFHYTDDFEREKNGTDPEQPEKPHTHTWDAGKVTKPATCTADGVKTYTCTSCGKTKTENIKAAGHQFGAWKKTSDATVFAAEKQTRTCSVCKAQETRESGSKLKPTMKVTANKITLKVKQSTKGFKVTGLANGDSVKSYKSSNTKIFRVSKNGKITAGKKTGKAKLTITLESGLKKKVTVKVQKSDVRTTKIEGLDKKLTLAKGKKTTLRPQVKPFTSKEKITYASSNKKIVTVNSRGVVKAVKPGKAKITVKSGSKKFVVTVKVTKK